MVPSPMHAGTRARALRALEAAGETGASIAEFARRYCGPRIGKRLGGCAALLGELRRDGHAERSNENRWRLSAVGREWLDGFEPTWT